MVKPQYLRERTTVSPCVILRLKILPNTNKKTSSNELVFYVMLVS